MIQTLSLPSESNKRVFGLFLLAILDTCSSPNKLRSQTVVILLTAEELYGFNRGRSLVVTSSVKSLATPCVTELDRLEAGREN